MHRKIRLLVPASVLPLLEQQLLRVGQLRDLLVDLLQASPGAWDHLIYQYKLMGQVRAMVQAHPTLAEVPFHVLLAYACDLCNAVRAQGVRPADANQLRRQRPSLLYQGQGFQTDGSSLHLQLPESTIVLELKNRVNYQVAKLRVYRYEKDGYYYGTFSEAKSAALPAPDEPTPAKQGGAAGIPGRPARPQPQGAAAGSQAQYLEALRAKLKGSPRPAAPPPCQEMLQWRRDLQQHLDKQTDWLRYLAEQLVSQQQELAALRAEVERRRALPWLN